MIFKHLRSPDGKPKTAGKLLLIIFSAFLLAGILSLVNPKPIDPNGKLVVPPADNGSLAGRIAECMPKSDTESARICSELLKQITDFDSCAAAGFSIMKSNPPQCAAPDGRTFIQKTNSTWEQALSAVNNCEAESVYQTNGMVVTLMLKNGNELTAIEPESDDIITIVRAAESKCGKIPMATE